MSQSTNPDRGTAGFTLLEVLIALSIIVIGLASVGKLVATSIRGAYSIEGRLIRLETARSVMAALPDRNQLFFGFLSGAIANNRWRVEVRPFTTTDIALQQNARWTPTTVAVTVASPAGVEMKINTITLRRSDDK